MYSSPPKIEINRLNPMKFQLWIKILKIYYKDILYITLIVIW